MLGGIIFLLCSVLPWADSMPAVHIERQAIGLRNEAINKSRVIQFLQDTGRYVHFEEKIQLWQNKWTETKKAPRVKLTKTQLKWWDSLIYRRDPKKPQEPETTKKRRRKRKRRRTTAAPSLISQVRRKRALCDPIPSPGITRIEWRRMSTAMRNSFRNAFNSLASFDPGLPGTSAHDIFVAWHNAANSPGAHGGASFLPWHREYLWRFENALRERGYEYGLPYWDSSLDAMLPDPSMSALFTTQHMGISSGAVTTWGDGLTTITAPPSCFISGSANIQRNAASGPTTDLFDRNEVNDVLALSCYRDLTWGWNMLFEGHHNNGHVWFGWDSHMIDPQCSPVDPMFWLHHCYIDLVWEKHREGQDPREREIDYPLSNVGFPASAKSWNSVMKPFSGEIGFGPFGDRLMNIHGLSNHYTSYYYQYETRPSSLPCADDAACNGAGPGLLWCEMTTCFCYAKIQEGGACNAFWPNNQCWCVNPIKIPVCSGGTCQCQWPFITAAPVFKTLGPVVVKKVGPVKPVAPVVLRTRAPVKPVAPVVRKTRAPFKPAV